MFEPEDFVGGATAPPVSTADLEAVLRVMKECSAVDEQRGGHRSIGMNLFQAVCNSDADVGAVWVRAAILVLAREHGELDKYMADGNLSDAVLRLWATFPFRAVNLQSGGNFQLNGAEFDEQLEKVAKDHS